MVCLTFLAFAQPVLAQPVKIMPLGSWTAGANSYVSYRYDLWFKLSDEGYDINFVGSKTHPAFFDQNLYPKYLTDFDRDNEGLPRLLSSQMVEPAKRAAADYEPDIVLIWMGSSDIFQQGSSGVNAANIAIRNTIEGIRSSVPGVTLLLGLTHRVPVLNQANVDALNDAIATIASDLDTLQSPVIVVDHVTGFDSGSMIQDDGIHHNRVGEAFVAENWFEVLASIIPDFEPEPEPFQINAGHAGAWFNPETPGQGLLIDVEPESNFLFASWFTFTDAASENANEPHWFTAQGNFMGDTAELVVYETLGGQFDGPQEVGTNAVGNATLSFSDCAGGRLDYTIDAWGVEGSFPMQRAIAGTENVCEKLAGLSAEPLETNDGRDGAWFDPASPGQGFLIDAQPGNEFIFVAWFTYGEDTVSGQRWLTAQGPLVGTSADLIVYETLGGSFDDPNPSETNAVGTMTIDFTDCNNAQLDYSITDEALAGTIDIERAIPGTEALCEELSQ